MDMKCILFVIINKQDIGFGSIEIKNKNKNEHMIKITLTS